MQKQQLRPARQRAACTRIVSKRWLKCPHTRTGGGWGSVTGGATRFNTVLSMAGSDLALGSVEHEGTDEAREFAIAMAKVADDTKVEDLCVLHVAPLVSWTSYLVVCTVISKPQLLAVLARMERAAEEDWGRSKQNQPGSSPWEVLDFGDTICHVFTPEQRDYYVRIVQGWRLRSCGMSVKVQDKEEQELEGFYAAAEEVELAFLADRATRPPSGMVPPPGQAWRTTLQDTS